MTKDELRPLLKRAYDAGRADALREQTRTFAADSDDSPIFRPAFTPDEVARYADYFAADANDCYPFSMSRHFGMGWRAFADATGLQRKHNAAGAWVWAKRAEAAKPFAEDAQGHQHDGKSGQFVSKGEGGDKAAGRARDDYRAERVLADAKLVQKFGAKQIERAESEDGGPLRALRRASDLYANVNRHAVLTFQLRAKDAGVTPEERERIDRAIEHIKEQAPAVERAVLKHATAALDSITDAPAVADAKAARKSLVIDLDAFPEHAREAVKALASKSGSVGALALGGLILMAKPKGRLAQIWEAVENTMGHSPFAGRHHGDRADDLVEDLWERSKAPVQFAVADVPEAAKGRSGEPDERAPNPSDALRYKRLSRDLMLRYDPTGGGTEIVARSDVPETIGVPEWAQTDTGEPPPKSGYVFAEDARGNQHDDSDGKFTKKKGGGAGKGKKKAEPADDFPKVESESVPPESAEYVSNLDKGFESADGKIAKRGVLASFWRHAFDRPGDAARAGAMPVIEARMRAAGMTPIAAPGDTVSFNGRIHEATTGVSDGQSVKVVRAGWTHPDEAGEPTLRAKVEAVGKEFAEEHAASEVRPAA